MADGRGSIVAIKPKMFPDEWYRRPTPEWLQRWQDSVALNRGTWVLVDHLGRPMEVTVRTGKNRAFVDVSRAARCRRRLELLLLRLEILETYHSEPSVQRRRQVGLQRLDQALGDLSNVELYAVSNLAVGRDTRARARREARPVRSSSRRSKYG